VCETGEQRCAEAELARCNDGRTDFDAVEECVSAALCQLSLENANTECEGPRCDVGEHACSAEALVVCNTDRTDFEVEQLCGSPALCEPLAGSCFPSSCEPGEHRCNGAGLEVCNDDLTGFVLEQQCASAALCRDGGAAGCEAPVCSPGQASCLDRRTLGRCNADLTGFDEDTCGLLGCNDNADPPECRSLFGL
jgi:hypothetical protein